MTSNNSVSSKAARERLKARGGVAFGVSLQPDRARIIEHLMAIEGMSRNAAVNHAIGFVGDAYSDLIAEREYAAGVVTVQEPDDLGPVDDNPTGSEA